MNNVLKLYKCQETVFNASQIAILLGIKDRQKLKSALNYYVKAGYFLNPRKGIYVKDENYSRFEFGNKLYSPSYVSLDTVLASEGVIFQYDSRIYYVSYLSRELEIDLQGYIYKKMDKRILYEKEGVVFKDGYFQAEKERAFLDKIYYSPDFYFDNLSGIDWEKCISLANIYGVKKIFKLIDKFRKNV